MDLIRLSLERAQSADQAVELAGRLADDLEPGGRRAAIPAVVEAWRRLNAEVGLPSPEGAGAHAPA